MAKPVRLESLSVNEITKRQCATEGCCSTATWHVESGNVGSYYCGDCAMDFIKLANPLPEGKE